MRAARMVPGSASYHTRYSFSIGVVSLTEEEELSALPGSKEAPVHERQMYFGHARPTQSPDPPPPSNGPPPLSALCPWPGKGASGPPQVEGSALREKGSSVDGTFQDAGSAPLTRPTRPVTDSASSSSSGDQMSPSIDAVSLAEEGDFWPS